LIEAAAGPNIHNALALTSLKMQCPAKRKRSFRDYGTSNSGPGSSLLKTESRNGPPSLADVVFSPLLDRGSWSERWTTQEDGFSDCAEEFQAREELAPV
jgi:hypothetical protein